MTLSGKGDPKARRERAKQNRRGVDNRVPWLLPALVALAGAVVALALLAPLWGWG